MQLFGGKKGGKHTDSSRNNSSKNNAAAHPKDTTIMITMQRASRARILRSRPIRLRAGKNRKRRARPERSYS